MVVQQPSMAMRHSDIYLPTTSINTTRHRHHLDVSELIQEAIATPICHLHAVWTQDFRNTRLDPL